ncbi:MAG: hypothetical protein E4H25_07225, partial [Methanomassiliicoccus sp.]
MVYEGCAQIYVERESERLKKMKNERIVSSLAVCIVSLLALCSLASVPPAAGASFTPEWQVGNQMPTNKTQAVVVQDADGMVYVISGVMDIDGYAYTAAVPESHVFDPATGLWSEISPIPVGVAGAAGAVGNDGMIYVFGGNNASLGYIATTQIYDPATDTWSAGTDAPAPLWEAKAAPGMYNDILVVGGFGFGSSMYAYDADTDSWSPLAIAPDEVVAGAFVKDGSYYYYFGGATISSPDGTDSLFRYYYWGDSWTTLDAMPVMLSSHAAILGPDELIYVLGGAADGWDVGPGDNSSYCYNPDSGEWTQLNDLPISSRYLGAAMSPEGYVYAIGGNNDTIVLSDVISLQVYRNYASLSETTLSAGDSFAVTLSIDLANVVPQNGIEYMAIVMSSDDTPSNPVYGWVSGEYSSVAFDMTVPVTFGPGDYTVLVSWYIGTDAGGIEFVDIELEFTVLSAYTLEEQVAMLEENLTAL